jgi:hypothetical protein
MKNGADGVASTPLTSKKKKKLKACTHALSL